MTKIGEWFDPYNKDHCAAYEHLLRCGAWPKDFLPDDIEFEPSWQILVMSKLSDAWIDHLLHCEKLDEVT